MWCEWLIVFVVVMWSKFVDVMVNTPLGDNVVNGRILLYCWLIFEIVKYFGVYVTHMLCDLLFYLILMWCFSGYSEWGVGCSLKSRICLSSIAFVTFVCTVSMNCFYQWSGTKCMQFNFRWWCRSVLLFLISDRIYYWIYNTTSSTY